MPERIRFLIRPGREEEDAAKADLYFSSIASGKENKGKLVFVKETGAKSERSGFFEAKIATKSEIPALEAEGFVKHGK